MKAFTLALLAVVGETLADALEPSPIKIVIDDLSQRKGPPGWLTRILSGPFGRNEFAILNFAVAAVPPIAVIDAISTYGEKYFTVSISQWISHDLRRICAVERVGCGVDSTGCASVVLIALPRERIHD